MPRDHWSCFNRCNLTILMMIVEILISNVFIMLIANSSLNNSLDFSSVLSIRVFLFNWLPFRISISMLKQVIWSTVHSGSTRFEFRSYERASVVHIYHRIQSLNSNLSYGSRVSWLYHPAPDWWVKFVQNITMSLSRTNITKIDRICLLLDRGYNTHSHRFHYIQSVDFRIQLTW